MTNLKTRDIPNIIGLGSEALAKMMDAMSFEYCKWWCGQANQVDAELLYQNEAFQDWWLDKWLIQDHRFLTYAQAKMATDKGITQKAMMVTYQAYHAPVNHQIEADGNVVTYKTMLPVYVQRKFQAERTGLDRTVRELLSSISSN